MAKRTPFSKSAEGIFTMRRSDREITDRAAIDGIIRQALVCRLGLSKDDQPYVVPLSFGYHEDALYFHGAPEGQKVAILKENDRVCFEFDTGVSVVEGELACAWTMKYQSVIGFGRAVLLEGIEEKRSALDIIMGHYSDQPFSYPEPVMEHIVVIKVMIESITGKESEC